MSYRVKNKLVKRRVYGVERLVGFDRRGNLIFQTGCFRAIFLSQFEQLLLNIKIQMR